MFYHVTMVSTNQKVGPIPVSTTSAETCPTSCPLNNHKGCYADSGPLAIHWRQVTERKRGMDFDAFLSVVAAFPDKQIWRYAQAGDLPGTGDSIDADQLRKLAKANDGRPVIAYTHKPPVGSNLAALKEAEALGFRINLSADDLDEADEFVDLGMHTVVTLPEEYGRKTKGKEWAETTAEYRERVMDLQGETPKGNKIVVCPATFADTNCANCQVCATKKQQNYIVGFPAHGSRKNQITNADRMASLRTKRPEGH